MSGLYRFARGLLWVVARLVFHIEYEGLENIPQQRGGYIVAGNHASNLDPVVLAICVRPMIHFMAKEELVARRWAHWLFSKKLGIVPVSRGTGDMSAVERCAQLTREGGVLGIFPEGTRYSAGIPGRPKSGMALIARMTGADVLPFAVRYERPLHFRSKIIVRFGKLIPHGELGLDADSPRALKLATKRVWGDVLSMLEVSADET